jgi:4-carboxymuconolactone decarboxylase
MQRSGEIQPPRRVPVWVAHPTDRSVFRETVPTGGRRPEKEANAMAENELFERGLLRRREVLGSEYVDANLRDSDGFMMVFQRAVTEVAWGWAWSRPGLDAKTRCMISLALLTALGRFDELEIYVKGAHRNEVSVEEIQEVLIQAIAYCGTPTGRQAFLAAHRALSAEGALG